MPKPNSHATHEHKYGSDAWAVNGKMVSRSNARRVCLRSKSTDHAVIENAIDHYGLGDIVLTLAQYVVVEAAVASAVAPIHSAGPNDVTIA